MSTICQNLLLDMRALPAKTKENGCTDHEGRAVVESATPSPGGQAVSAFVSPVAVSSRLIFLTCVGVSPSNDTGGGR
ncbi:MAG TPA: hypothetical protein VGP86_04080 [Xanthobacteraceae bacterium]|jgi:hypothetical protein|nr:hypothetical protein [Xanthobacteraceae bacterium]